MQIPYHHLPRLETERLTLHPVRMDDVDDIFVYASDPRVSELLEWPAHTSIDDTREIVSMWIDNAAQNKITPWVLFHKKDNRVIGALEARTHQTDPEQAELGYCLSSSYWGKGLMHEALHTVINYLFQQTQITIIIAFVRNDNPQSQRLLKKAGFHCDLVAAKTEIMKGKKTTLDRWSLIKHASGQNIE